MAKMLKHKLMVLPDQTAKLKKMLTVLSGISDKVRIDWDGDKAHLYSMLSVGNDIQGFCSYYVDSEEIWDNAPNEGTFIFYSAKTYLEGLKHWDSQSVQNWTIERRDDREYYHQLRVKCGDLSVPFHSAYATDVRKIGHDKIIQRLGAELSFDLVLSPEQMMRISKLVKAKKLQHTTSDAEDTIRITVEDDSIIMSSGWELSFETDQVLQNGDYYFLAKYLTLMKEQEGTEYVLRIHDTYVSVPLGSDSYYMFPLDIM